MAGVKGRSGRYPKGWTSRQSRLKTLDLAALVIQRELEYLVANWDTLEPNDRLDRVKTLALPLNIKNMTDKQAITQITATMSLTSEQATELITIARRNSLIYKDLEQNTPNVLDSPGQSGTEIGSGGGGAS